MKHYVKKIGITLMACFLVCCSFIISDTVAAKKIVLDPETVAQRIADSQTNIADPQFSSGGANHTHQYIVTQALAILRNDKGNSLLQNSSNASTLKSYTDWPDKLGNETDYATFSGHFYNPYTEKNFLGSKSTTALNRAVSYLDDAVAAFRAGSISDALMNLGKGTHYVSDLNEPHHASNLTAVNSNHSAFEKYVDNNRTSFYISGNTLSRDYYQEALSQTISKTLRDGAFYAYDLQYAAQDESRYYEAANLSVQHAIINVAQYLYRFGYEVGIYTE